MVTVERAVEAPMRIAAGLHVSATVLGVTPYRFHTIVEDWAQRPIVFSSPKQIVAGAPVKLETEEFLWLGHVMECRRGEDGFRTLLQVEHALSNLPELLNLTARFE